MQKELHDFTVKVWEKMEIGPLHGGGVVWPAAR